MVANVLNKLGKNIWRNMEFLAKKQGAINSSLFEQMNLWGMNGPNTRLDGTGLGDFINSCLDLILKPKNCF